MATEDSPARKMRRIIEDDDDSDGSLPDISDPAFLMRRKALTPPLAKSEDNSEDDELFGDEDEDEEDEAPATSSKKRSNFQFRMTLTIVGREMSVMPLKMKKWPWTMKRRLRKSTPPSYKNTLSPTCQTQHPQTER